jgi:hypothetical protein
VSCDQLTIISGGQTGADRAALDFAILQGIDHGGWCPRGRLAEDGVIAEQYQLQETDSRRYDQRTKENVRTADVTVLMTVSPELRGGTAMTARYAENIGKPWLHLCRDGEGSDNVEPDSGCSIEEMAQRLRSFITEHKACRINVAGPRASQEHEVGAFVRDILTAVFIG